MKILVPVKRVVDHHVTISVKPDGSDVDIAGVKMAINPFDEIAVEEALRLKESGQATEVVAISIGTAASQDVLRHALAMGADRAILLETDAELQPLGVAKLLKAIADRETPQLLIVGKQAIDGDAGQVGQMLAALLGIGQATFASTLKIADGEVEVAREVEGGIETVAIKLPAVVTADLRLNEPRFVKLPNLMMAKKKPIETIAAADLGVDFTPRLKRLSVAEPQARAAGVKLNSVEELVAKLKNEAGVL
ncbi:electron transfer flavoprotein subunit beta/FixA family protein [Andreprevotia chitinilytica]|uniref:electron transfer flavoprotein subunit beta/FixA family protein n=1 Tax=Andreprevotia chitinilytica TaxID=396808 RepID=UPI000552A36A|nr:electron transfer flavoprotein subunit beta/FixA family protein [Andreprevotia chitinilytica]